MLYIIYVHNIYFINTLLFVWCNLSKLDAHVGARVDFPAAGHVPGRPDPVPDPGLGLRIHNLK